MSKSVKEEYVGKQINDEKPIKLPMSEKIGYAVGDLGTNLIFQTVAMFLLFFYTDVFGIAPAAASLLFLIARIWDAVNDPMMGFLVDRSNSKRGKFRPYLLRGAIPFAIFAILCFSTPNIPYAWKIVYAYVTYIGVGMMQTYIGIPYGALTSAMTQDPGQRTSITAIRMLLAVLGGLIVAIGVPILTQNLGGNNLAKGYQYTMMIFASIAAVLYFITYATTKERVSVEQKEKIKVSDIPKVLFKNRPLMVVSALFVIIFGNTAIMGASAKYYFDYYLERPELFGAFIAISMVFMLICLPFVPMLSKKIGKKTVLTVGLAISTVTPIGMFFLPATSITGLFIVRVIGAIGFAPLAGIIWSLVPDTIEYGELKTGKRTAGLVYAINGFFFKFGMALGGLVPGVLLQVSGYVAHAAQTPEALFAIKSLMTIVPFVLTVIGIIIFQLYNLDEKKYKEVLKQLNQIKN